MLFLLFVPLVHGRYSRARLALAALFAIPGGLLMVNSEAAQIAMNRYVETGIGAAGAAFRVAFLAVSGLSFFVVLRRPWQRSKAPDFKLLSIGSLAMIGLGALVPVSSVIADRLGYYLVPIQALMFARIPFLDLGRPRRFYASLAYVALGVTLVVWALLSWHFARCYVPYRTWLFGTPASRYPFGI